VIAQIYETFQTVAIERFNILEEKIRHFRDTRIFNYDVAVKKLEDKMIEELEKTMKLCNEAMSKELKALGYDTYPAIQETVYIAGRHSAVPID
jgi:hypothetical protein